MFNPVFDRGSDPVEECGGDERVGAVKITALVVEGELKALTNVPFEVSEESASQGFGFIGHGFRPFQVSDFVLVSKSQCQFRVELVLQSCFDCLSVKTESGGFIRSVYSQCAVLFEIVVSCVCDYRNLVGEEICQVQIIQSDLPVKASLTAEIDHIGGSDIIDPIRVFRVVQVHIHVAVLGREFDK
ncbi:hypothetical protein ES703_100920 [subsurface metagenome]